MRNLLFAVMVFALMGCTGSSGGGVVNPNPPVDPNEPNPLSLLTITSYSFSGGNFVFPNVSNSLSITVSDTDIVEKVSVVNQSNQMETDLSCVVSSSVLMACPNINSLASMIGSPAGNIFKLKVLRKENGQFALSATTFNISSDPVFTGPITGPVDFDLTQCSYTTGVSIAQSGFTCYPTGGVNSTSQINVSWTPIIVEEASAQFIGLSMGECGNNSGTVLSYQSFSNNGTDKYDFSFSYGQIMSSQKMSMVVYKSQEGMDDQIDQVTMCQDLGYFSFPNDTYVNSLTIQNDGMYVEASNIYPSNGQYKVKLAGSLYLYDPENVIVSYGVAIQNVTGSQTYASFMEEKFEQAEISNGSFVFNVPADAINSNMQIYTHYQLTTATGAMISGTLIGQLMSPLRVDTFKQIDNEPISISAGNDTIIIEGRLLERVSKVSATFAGVDYDITTFCSLSGNITCSGFANDLGPLTFGIKVEDSSGDYATSTNELTISP